MSIVVRCPNAACGKTLSVADGPHGQSLRCPHCHALFTTTPPASTAPRTSVGDSVPRPGSGLADSRIRSSGQGRREQPRSTSDVPHRIGRFEVRQELGSGAFGTVYRAYDPQLDREVALKVPHPASLADARQRQRFLGEAKAAARLRHPNIVPVHEAGHDGRHYYIASAFIAGRSLEQAIDDRPMGLRRCVQVVRELGEALAYAHDQGIVHRDVKPANVLLDEQGKPHLADFGLAHRHDVTQKLTHDGAVLGTPAYMAPEQAAGKKGEPLPASDQYSLGVVLYELLTGEVPFSGPTPLVLSHHVHTEPPPLRARHPELPRDLETVCLKTLAKRPEDRYGSCQELADDLRRWLEGEPIRARRLGPLERVVRLAWRRPALAAACVLAVLVVLLGGGAIGATLLWRQAEDAWGVAERARGLEEQARENAEQARAEIEKARRELVRLHYLRQVDLAHRDWQEANVVRARELLQACDPALRLWEWRYVDRLCHAYLQELKGHVDEVYSVAFSPNGRRLASASRDGTVRVWDAANGEEVFVLKGHAHRVHGVAFSPDGERLASASWDGTVRVWDAAKGRQVLTLRGHANVVQSVVFSPDGQRLASASWDGTVRVWDVANGQEVFVLKGHKHWVVSVAFSRDGQRLASAALDWTVKVWDAAKGREVLTLRGHAGEVASLAFSPNGRRLASASHDRTVRIWDAENGQEVLTLKGHENAVMSVAFSPDGRHLSSASWDKTVRLWDAANGQEVLTLKGHSREVWSVAFSPDGRRLASASWDGIVKVWDAASGEEVLAFKRHEDAVMSVAFSPDGQQLASASHDLTVRLWDAANGREVLALKGHADVVSSVAFSPDGRRLASASWDKTVRLWDTATGQEVLALKGHAKAIHSVAFSPDGHRLVSASEDKTVRVWDGSPRR